MNNKTKSMHIIFITIKHRKNFGIVVKEHEIIQPKVGKTDFIFHVVIGDCRDIFFHTFK